MLPQVPICVAAVGDPVREVPERQGRGLAQGRKILLQRVEQPRRRRARTADRQGELPRSINLPAILNSYIISPKILISKSLTGPPQNWVQPLLR